MANANVIFYNSSNPTETWNKVIEVFNSNQRLFAEGKVTPLPQQPASPDVKVVTLPDDIMDWTSEHVAAWVQSLSFPVPKEPFLHNWVHGPNFLELQFEDLVDSMKFTKLQAKRLMVEIEAVKANHSKRSSVLSKQGFKTGKWSGWYDNTGKQEPTSMDVSMIGNVVAGYGTDLVGDFLIQGAYSDNNLSICWEKLYIGQHVVKYTGKLVHNMTISGTWEISNDGGGTFSLHYDTVHKA